jgi:hypothetical protein
MTKKEGVNVQYAVLQYVSTVYKMEENVMIVQRRNRDMQINLSELKHLKNISEIENIKKIEIILPTNVNDEITNKYYMIFEIDSLNDLVCFTLTRFKSKSRTVDYWITVVTDEDGTGLELDISKKLWYEILGGVKEYEIL